MAGTAGPGPPASSRERVADLLHHLHVPRPSPLRRDLFVSLESVFSAATVQMQYTALLGRPGRGYLPSTVETDEAVRFTLVLAVPPGK